MKWTKNPTFIDLKWFPTFLHPWPISGCSNKLQPTWPHTPSYVVQNLEQNWYHYFSSLPQNVLQWPLNSITKIGSKNFLTFLMQKWPKTVVSRTKLVLLKKLSREFLVLIFENYWKPVKIQRFFLHFYFETSPKMPL